MPSVSHCAHADDEVVGRSTLSYRQVPCKGDDHRAVPYYWSIMLIYIYIFSICKQFIAVDKHRPRPRHIFTSGIMLLASNSTVMRLSAS